MLMNCGFLKIFRGAGYASMLMDEVVRLSKEMKLWKVRLYVSSGNEVARNYYRKNGYTEVDDCQCCEIDLI